eukprot:8670140-Alexandrium_andersonii.AAC.1
MSASLVGSEMCIRDSRRSMRLFTCLPNLACLESTLADTRITSNKERDVCLLYTSDAADDM